MSEVLASLRKQSSATSLADACCHLASQQSGSQPNFPVDSSTARRAGCQNFVKTFAGLRESEAFALWCGDITADGIHIERSWYKGRFESPKTPKSKRIVGVPDEILERLKVWTSKLPASGPSSCVFPSTTLVTPIWPESVLRNHIRPRLRPVNLGWVNFAVLRRSHSTLHKRRNSDLKIIADQQGHGMRTHLENCVQSGVAERKQEASKLYADFTGALHNQG